MSNKNKYRLIIMSGALICFAFVAFAVTSNSAAGFDNPIREWVYSLRGPILNKILITITYLGNWQSITLLALVLLALPKTRKNMGLPLVAVSLSSTLIYKLVKDCFQRPRPDLAVRIIEQGGYSFPSGHSMNGLVCFGILIYLIRHNCKNKKIADRLTIVLILLILAIGFSRVYVGVHFPTDILGGWSLGLAVLMAVMMILDKIREKKRGETK